MSLSKSAIRICQFIRNYNMNVHPNIADFSASEFVENYEDLTTTVLEYIDVAISRPIFDKYDPEYEKIPLEVMRDYIIDVHRFLKSFKIKGLSFLRNCYKAFKSTKNTMHKLYHLYQDTNEWIIDLNNTRNMIINYVKSEGYHCKLKKMVSELNRLYERIDTHVLLLFRAIKTTLIKNDNPLNLCDILYEESEFDTVNYLIPHIYNSIRYNAPNCFNSLYKQLLSVIDGDMPIGQFRTICLLAHKHKTTQIKRTITRSLPKLKSNCRDIYNEYLEAFDN